jgi:hypothetical protein
MRRHREVLSLFHAIGQEIAVIEGSARFNKRQFWGRMKFLSATPELIMLPSNWAAAAAWSLQTVYDLPAIDTDQGETRGA